MRYLRYTDFTWQNSESGRETVIGSFEVPRRMCYHLLDEPIRLYLARQPISDDLKAPTSGDCKLAGAIDDSATSFTLDDGAGGLPAGLTSDDVGKWFVIKIENELIVAKMTGTSGGAEFSNAVRGYSSTTAASHADNTDATVYNQAWIGKGILKIKVFNPAGVLYKTIFSYDPSLIMNDNFDQGDARTPVKLDMDFWVPEKFTIKFIYESSEDVFDADATYTGQNLKPNLVMIPYEPYDNATLKAVTGYDLDTIVGVVEALMRG